MRPMAQKELMMYKITGLIILIWCCFAMVPQPAVAKHGSG